MAIRVESWLRNVLLRCARVAVIVFMTCVVLLCCGVLRDDRDACSYDMHWLLLWCVTAGHVCSSGADLRCLLVIMVRCDACDVAFPCVMF